MVNDPGTSNSCKQQASLQEKGKGLVLSESKEICSLEGWGNGVGAATKAEVSKSVPLTCKLLLCVRPSGLTDDILTGASAGPKERLSGPKARESIEVIHLGHRTGPSLA